MAGSARDAPLSLALPPFRSGIGRRPLTHAVLSSRLAAGLAQRMEADLSFLYKLCVECGLDAAIILSVNLATRKDNFLSQLEFVGCQVSLGTALTVRSLSLYPPLSSFKLSSKPSMRSCIC